MSRIFLTGASGFLGSKLVEILLQHGHEVRGLSRREKPELPPGYEKPSDQLWDHPNFRFVRGDVIEEDSLRRAMQDCDRVFHLAAYARNWSPDKNTFFEQNILGMRNVFKIAREMGVRRIVWTSSVVSFGPSRAGEVRGESTAPRLVDTYFTEYERTKSLAEKEALRCVAEGLPLVIVNPTRVYGPGQLSEGNAVAQLIADYVNGKAPFLPNRGRNIGNYGFLDDVARGHLLAMEKGRIGERYILGGENISLRELYEFLDELTGKKRLKIPLLKFGPLIFGHIQLLLAKTLGIYPRITPGWVRTFMEDWAYSCEKAKSELGYTPLSLREGLEITLQWLKKTGKI